MEMMLPAVACAAEGGGADPLGGGGITYIIKLTA